GDRHPADLERLAAKALSSGDFAAAFSYVDRRCRIEPPARAHCYLLRAEAAWRLGNKLSAMEDIDQALATSPHELNALQRLFAWADDDRRQSAATSLIAQDYNPSIIRAAIAELLQHTNKPRWASISVFDTVVTGWIAWTGKRRIEVRLTLENGTLAHIIDADPFHPLASRKVSASSFRLRRPSSLSPQYFQVLCDGESVISRRLAPNAPVSLRATPAEREDITDERSVPTVIVPVYGDREATIACFESLLLARDESKSRRRSERYRILAIDDASPEPELKSYLRKLADAHEIELITNELNLGFVGAINRALERTTTGDVILLNADTVVPPGFVDRL
ncbi:MAG TPA: glycosyltransferase, partial [Chloroflexota bacterium]|nr:glycosyltransferase [Chloroflexota bacterium]